MNRRNIPLVVIVVLVILGVGAWALANKMQQPAVVSPTPLTPEPSATTTVYRNDTYGFELIHPANLAPETSFRSYYALSDKWRALAPEGQSGTAIVSIPVFRVDNPDGVATGKPYPLYFSAEVRVGASSDPKAVADCLKTDAGYADQQHAGVVLNGTLYERFEFGDAAMMQYAQGASYRTVRDNTCFAIEQLKAGSIYRDESMSPGLSDSELDAYFAKAGEIARTIKFTR